MTKNTPSGAKKGDRWIIVHLKWSRLRITRRNSGREEWWQQANMTRMNAQAGARNRFQPAGARILDLNDQRYVDIKDM